MLHILLFSASAFEGISEDIDAFLAACRMYVVHYMTLSLVNGYYVTGLMLPMQKLVGDKRSDKASCPPRQSLLAL